VAVLTPDAPPLRLGISSCLLGEKVRFDGGHKRDVFLVESLGPFVEWVPVCPELECGMGSPREALRLIRKDGDVHLVTRKTERDYTGTMRQYARRRLAELDDDDLCGFVLKKDSPSCGLERVKEYGAGGIPVKSGRGIFAAALVERFPTLPMEEEGRLTDPRLRENFIERIFAYQRLRIFFESRWTIADLVRFHTRHKMTLLAHVPESDHHLGRMVANAKSLAHKDLRERYTTAFMDALRTMATPRRHANVLQHMLGHFKDTLDRDSRNELLELIDAHRIGRVPLVVPLTLMRHHIRRSQVAYLADQLYLDPHPAELMLRNHV
jgi:uncharacterized protein YbgA (DUF1722 family)/uncharacterized protein YbbK (DUF523 family)